MIIMKLALKEKGKKFKMKGLQKLRSKNLKRKHRIPKQKHQLLKAHSLNQRKKLHKQKHKKKAYLNKKRKKYSQKLMDKQNKQKIKKTLVNM